MRIAHLANFYGPKSGGLRTVVHALGEGYTGHGHDFMMIVPGPDNSDEMTPYGRRVTIKAPELPGSGGYRVILRTHRVRKVLEDFAPDRLEVSDRTTLRGLGSWARRHGIPSVFFSHERADGIMDANVPRWARKVLPIVPAANWHNRGTWRRFSTVVCTTQYAAEEFDRIDLETARVPLGVDLEFFGPRHYSDKVRGRYAEPDEALLAMASRLSTEKRPDLAIEAVRILRERGRKVRLVSAGAGNIADEMAELAEGLPVTFLGFVDGRDQYAALLATADVLVAPGPIETFGLAALEGLASGTPVVVNGVSALPEVVGNAGAVAESTPEGFADAIEDLLDRDPASRRRAARERAETFPWSETIRKMLDLHNTRL